MHKKSKTYKNSSCRAGCLQCCCITTNRQQSEEVGPYSGVWVKTSVDIFGTYIADLIVAILMGSVKKRKNEV